MKEDKNAVAETKEAPQKEAKKDGKKKLPTGSASIRTACTWGSLAWNWVTE